MYETMILFTMQTYKELRKKRYNHMSLLYSGLNAQFRMHEYVRSRKQGGISLGCRLLEDMNA